MAVELNRVSKDPTLSLFYHFEKEEQLENISNTLYAFPETTTSMIKFHESESKPVRIHLTTVLHKGFGSHDFELIVEYDGNLFFCFALLRKTNNIQPSEFTFPLKESPLEKMFHRCSNANTLYYQTSTKSHVFFCKPEVYVGDDFPLVLDKAKAKYKEIFEPNAFDIFNNLFTRNDYKLKVISAAEGGQFRQYTPTLTEGFAVDSYMECSLLEDIDGNAKMSEYAITPLKTNRYERGIVTIVSFLNFLLIILVGGVLLPWIQCYGKPDTWKAFTWYIIFRFLHISILLISIVLLAVGINTNKSNSRQIAVFGIYFLILFLSNAAGMKGMFPTCPLFDNATDVTGRSLHHMVWQVLFNPMWNSKFSDTFLFLNMWDLMGDSKKITN